ncbi:MAG TPA: response regulator [Bacteriovoracaceae bacterium]|nr:response regulator [Bacteriovoracaceae bacterium]
MAHTSKKKTILAIDDDADILYSLGQLLEFENFNILSAPNGRAALEQLNLLGDTHLPDLILLDYMMPEMDGGEFCLEKLKNKRLENIPVVLMTAKKDIRNLTQQFYADAYINKPMDVDTVIDLAYNFIDRRRAAQVSFLT